MSTLPSTVSPSDTYPAPTALKQRCQAWISRYIARLAYQNKTAEWVAITLFFSGLLLWDAIPVDWAIARWSLILHLLVGLIVFPLTTGLFWVAHRRLMLTSDNAFLRKTGALLDIIIGTCFVTGLVLTFLGETGNLPSNLTADAHWLSGLILGPIMLVHAWRYSVLRFKSSPP